jgi:hypothetical protein
MVELSSDEDEIQEESPIHSPPPLHSLSKSGHGTGRIEGEGPSMPSQPPRGGRKKWPPLALAGVDLRQGTFPVKNNTTLKTMTLSHLRRTLLPLGASACIRP